MPNCHDAIHHGQIELSDDTVYQWKRIQRSFEEIREHLYVEPSTPLRLLLGSLALRIRVGTFNLFETGSANRLRFQTADKEILHLFSYRSRELAGLDARIIFEEVAAALPAPAAKVVQAFLQRDESGRGDTKAFCLFERTNQDGEVELDLRL